MQFPYLLNWCLEQLNFSNIFEIVISFAGFGNSFGYSVRCYTETYPSFYNTHRVFNQKLLNLLIK